MSPDNLLLICKETYAVGNMTVEQLEQNVEDVLARRRLSAPTPGLRSRILNTLLAQVRYIGPDTINEIIAPL